MIPISFTMLPSFKFTLRYEKKENKEILMLNEFQETSKNKSGFHFKA